MKTGFYIGRFQPFHLGHLSAIKQALHEVDFLIIGIGSAQYDHESKNPFTADERKKMIRSALKENEIEEKRWQIVPIPDIHNNEKWPHYVRSLTPDFDTVFVSEKGLVKELFEKYDNIPVKILDKEIDISGTKIRDALVNDKNWKAYLSPLVAGYLESIDAINRLKSLQ